MLSHYILYFSLFAIVLTSACNSSSSEEAKDNNKPEHNVLKEYVKTPLDRTNAMADKANERTNSINKALSDIQ